MRGRYLLGLFVALAVLFAPSLAFADDGFVGGLQDLVGTREVEQETVTPERDFTDEYEPVYVPLRSGDETVAEEGNEIETVVDSFNTLQMAGIQRSLLDSVIVFFGKNTGVWGGLFLIPAVGLVFMWWGVRKALRMLMNAWRKGHASV